MYFQHVQDDLNLCILRMLVDTFLLDMDHMIWSYLSHQYLLFALMAQWLRHRFLEGHHKIIATEGVLPVVHDETVQTLEHIVVYQIILHLSKFLF